MTQSNFVLDLTNLDEKFPDYVPSEPVFLNFEEQDNRLREKTDLEEYMDDEIFLNSYVNGHYISCFFQVGKFHYLNVLEGILEDERISMADKIECINFAFQDGRGHYLNYDRWEKILKGYGRQLLAVDLDKNFYKRLPEMVTIYRGVSSEGINGFSWTLNRKVAKWFAVQNIIGESITPLLLKGKVNKSDIITVYDNEEEEIVVFPENVRLTATIKTKSNSMNFRQALAA